MPLGHKYGNSKPMKSRIQFCQGWKIVRNEVAVGANFLFD